MDAPALSNQPPELKPTPPLLPALLVGPAALFWLWVLPLGILLALNLQGYRLISGNMDAAQLAAAHRLGLVGLINLLAGLGLCVATLRLRMQPPSRLHRHADWAVPLAAIAIQVAYLSFALATYEKILPPSVTVWIYTYERFFYNQFSFVMLPLALGVFRLASFSHTPSLQQSIVISVGLLALSPILLNAGFIILSIVEIFTKLSPTIMVSLVVVLSVVFFVSLVRVLLFGLRKIKISLRHGERIAIVLFAGVFPFLGLLLNRLISFPEDFQAREVYALVAVNTAILLFASFQHAARPRLSFALLCATFPFSLYFFIVFLPYTPFSLLAVIFFGVGFLVLSPTVLFVLQLHLLNQARHSPSLNLRPARLVLLGLACASLLPGFFLARAVADKAALHAALDYVFTPAIKPGNLSYASSLPNLRRALVSHRNYKKGIYYPLLSDAYAWLVFDDLVLPDDKLARLETTFLGATGSHEKSNFTRNLRAELPARRSSVRDRTRMTRAGAPNRNVEVTQLTAHATSAGENATTVTLALTLNHLDSANSNSVAEYLKTLPLPSGIFVHGFRLHMNGVAVPGRIFEKKTALWVYTMIRDQERRDPGLLYYRTPEELELRVFPIEANKPATVEIDFLVPGTIPTAALATPLLDPAAFLAQLGTLTRAHLTRDALTTVATGHLDGLNLPVVERAPYLHLIIDRSLAHAYDGDLNTALRAVRKKFPAAANARITLAHHDLYQLVTPLSSLEALIAAPALDFSSKLPTSGGLALDLALAHALREHRDLDLNTASNAPAARPIFVILSRHAEPRTLDLNLTQAWSDLVPALELHELGADGTWLSHLAPAADATPLLRLGEAQRPLHPAHAVRFPSTAAPTVALTYWSSAYAEWRAVPDLNASTTATPWTRALALQLRQNDHARSPGDAATDLKSLVQASRETGVLLATTSYIVVENSAQWRTLEASEKQKLGQNTALAFRETPAPPALWLAGAFIIYLVYRARKKRVPTDA